MVSKKEYWEFSSAVADRLIDMASTDAGRWKPLIKRLPDLPPAQMEKAVEQLTELAGTDDVAENARSEIWSALDALIRQHRAFSDADWALPDESLDRLSTIAGALAPGDPVAKNKWLFDSQFPDLGSKREDFSEQEEKIALARKAAVREVLEKTGLIGIVRLAEESEYPWFVGTALADSELTIKDKDVVAMLDDPGRHKTDIAFGFSARRASARGWDWIGSSLHSLADRPLAQSRLLRCADDPRAWQLAEDLGSEVDAAYWREFVPYGRGHDFVLVNETAEQLLAHDRPGAALHLLTLYVGREGQPVSPELIAQGFDALVGRSGDDPEAPRIQSYEVEQLLGYLRSSDLDEERLATLEWRLLPAISFDARSPILERKLSRDPRFFVEILSLCFKPRRAEEAPKVSSRVAENAFRLLREWKIVPGTSDRGAEVDEKSLREWVYEARRLLEEADRAEIGDIYIGQVFAHAREDLDGTWPTVAVRNVIESLASTEIEDGFRTETYNKRGITSRGLADGGRQEYDLASDFDGWAGKVVDKWPRTSAVLRSLADGYRAEGRLMDEQSESFQRDNQ